MKKRIFIAIHYLEIGGAEISLIGLLSALDYSKYDVDLFVHSHQGELMPFIPKEVNLLPEIPAYAYIERPMKDALKAGQWGVVLGRLKAKWQMRQYRRKNHPTEGSAVFQYVFSAVEPYLPSLRKFGEYDLAISFLTPHNIVLNKVAAKKKVCWIHTDYSRVDVDTALELPVWSGFDHIVSISPDVTRTFLQKFPTLSGKIVEMENILSPDFVRGRAEMIPAETIEQEMPREQGVTRILSVGRFTTAKNYDNVPDICRRILEKGIAVKWYLIGYGGDEALIRQRIADCHMERHVIILGKKSNPYPYIKSCDIYAQPSRFEGKSVTVREAQILCKPVVVTDYATARSQVAHELDGIIVPLANADCAKTIAQFIQNQPLQRQLVSYLHSHDYGNVAEAKKIDLFV